MPKYTVIAKVSSIPEKVHLVKAELEKLVPLTRAEAGCIKYDLHQDTESPEHFWLYEIWGSKNHTQAHAKASHSQAFVETTNGAVANFELHEISLIVE